MQYAYDSGANGIGRLNIVTGPHFTRSYDYDDLGRIASETFEYNLSGTSVGGAVVGSKTRTFSYTRAGSPSQLTTAAGLSLRYQHDSVGRENALIWENSGSGALEIATLTRNAAGSVIEHATNTNVVRSWRYDQLGRVERTDVTRA